MPLLAALLLVVTLAGFGPVTATATAAGPGEMTVEVTVQVAASDGPVVAHLTLPGEEVTTLPLVDRGDGTWTLATDLRRADWRIVFEAVSAGRLSDPVSLVELGVDRALLVPAPDPPPPSVETPGRPGWEWLALGSAAAALAILIGLVASGSLRPRHLRSPRSRRSASN